MRSAVRSVIAVLGLLPVIGCSGPSATVTGTVTCGGKPVPGGILFSPKGDGEGNKGPAVNAELKDDGTFEIQLTTIGKHTVVVTPRDLKHRVKPGEFAFPCSLAPKDYDVEAGSNTISIELTSR
jgi:hypothetical protein